MENMRGEKKGGPGSGQGTDSEKPGGILGRRFHGETKEIRKRVNNGG